MALINVRIGRDRRLSQAGGCDRGAIGHRGFYVGLRGRTRLSTAAGAAGQRLYAGSHAGGTASVDIAAGAAQKFDVGRDIPGEWWKVFHSRELDALIAEALQANPSLQAAQAALWQAKENLYAQAGKLLPTVDRHGSGDAPAILAGGIWRHRSAVTSSICTRQA